MSDAISVECPKCHAKLKLKSRSAVGKRVPCPKCKQPFVVATPLEGDDLDFMNVSEPEADEFAESTAKGESEEFADAAPAMERRSSSKKNSKKRKAAPANWQKPVLLGGLVVLVVGLLGGVGYFVYPLIADLLNGNKIDMAWLPPDADVVAHARVADASNSPFAKAVMPAGKGPGIGNLRDALGFNASELRSVTFGASGSLEQMRRLGNLAPMGGFIPGAPGMPRGPGIAGMPAAAGSASESITVLRTVEPLDTPKLQERIKLSHTNDYQTRTLIYSDGPTLAGQVCFLADSKTIVVGGEKNVKAAIDRGPRGTRRADLDFIDANRQVVVVFAPKDPAAFDSNGPPNPMGGQALANLEAATKGKLRGFCLGLTCAENLDVSMAANCTTADTAKDVSNAIDKALQEGKAQFNQLRSMMPPQFSEMVVILDGILNSIKVQTRGTVTETTAQIPPSIKILIDKLPNLMMAGMMGGMAGAGGPPADGGFNPELFTGPEKTPIDPSQPGAVSDNPGTSDEPAERARSRSNLREIGLAMLQHEQSNMKFPAAAIRDGSGKPLLSWRVALLPYLNQGALYKEFHLNEPWNSDHNKPLMARMPDVFACPNSRASPGSTGYLAVTGPGSMFEGSQSLRLLEILDGTANTIAVVEANDSRAVPWTCPDDLVYDPAAPTNGLVGHHAGGFLALTCDGAVHFISETIDPKTLLALFTFSGGERVDVNAIK